MITINTTGGISNKKINESAATVPVINLSTEYVNTMVGIGTMSDPYRAA